MTTHTCGRCGRTLPADQPNVSVCPLGWGCSARSTVDELRDLEERARNEMEASRAPYADGTARAWRVAWATYHEAAIASGAEEFASCLDCDGTLEVETDIVAIPASIRGPAEYEMAPCSTCEARPGAHLCDYCGEFPATTHVGDGDLFCANCAREAK